MVVGQSGVVLRDNSQSILAGTATGGSTTQLDDSAATFIADGVQAGDQVIMWERSGVDQRVAVATIPSETSVTFSAVPTPVAVGTRYMIVRPTLVILKGGITIQHRPRVPVLDNPGRDKDTVQFLKRKSRRAIMQDAQIYRGDIPESGRDAIHVVDANQLRSWNDASTDLWLDTLTEADLKVHFLALDVTEQAGAKGFPVMLELVEVT